MTCGPCGVGTSRDAPYQQPVWQQVPVLAQKLIGEATPVEKDDGDASSTKKGPEEEEKKSSTRKKRKGKQGTLFIPFNGSAWSTLQGSLERTDVHIVMVQEIKLDGQEKLDAEKRCQRHR